MASIANLPDSSVVGDVGHVGLDVCDVVCDICDVGLDFGLDVCDACVGLVGLWLFSILF